MCDISVQMEPIPSDVFVSSQEVSARPVPAPEPRAEGGRAPWAAFLALENILLLSSQNSTCSCAGVPPLQRRHQGCQLSAGWHRCQQPLHILIQRDQAVGGDQAQV